MRMGKGWWYAMNICRSGSWSVEVEPIPVRQPRVGHRDKRRFSSAILPKYMRRAPNVDALLPAPLPQRDLDRRFPGERSVTFIGGPTASISRPNSTKNEPACWP